MGIRTIVTDNNKNAPAKQFADVSLNVDTYDLSNIESIARQYSVEGIFSGWSDKNSASAALMNEKLNLPNSYNYESITKLIDKRSFKDIIIESGLEATQLYFSGNQESFRDVRKIKYPALVKPLDSGGSKGISVAYDQNGLLSSIKNAQNNSLTKNFLIEKYYEDVDFIVIDVWVQDGIANLIGVAERYLSKQTNQNFIRSTIAYIYPSKYEKFVLANFSRHIDNFVKKMHIENGILSLEALYDKDSGKLLFFECQPRLGGTHFYRFLRKDTGFDLLEQMILYCSGQNFTQKYKDYAKLSRTISACVNLHGYYGEIKTLEFSPKFFKNKFINWVQPVRYSGDTIKTDGSTRSYIMKVGLSATDMKDLDNKIKFVYENITVLDQKNVNMVNLDLLA